MANLSNHMALSYLKKMGNFMDMLRRAEEAITKAISLEEQLSELQLRRDTLSQEVSDLAARVESLSAEFAEKASNEEEAMAMRLANSHATLEAQWVETNDRLSRQNEALALEVSKRKAWLKGLEDRGKIVSKEVADRVAERDEIDRQLDKLRKRLG